MLGEKITIQDGKLLVPSQPIVPFIEGDGIGPDIWAAAVRVIDAAVEKAYGGSRKIIWKEVFAGEKASERTGDFLPQATLEAIKEYLVGIKGPLTTPVGGGFRSLNVALRQKLDLYACVRPVRWFNGVPSPVKKPQDVDMVIFRENTEDIYAGIEYNHGTPEVEQVKDFLINEMGVSEIRFPHTASIGIKPVSKEGTERLIQAAIDYTITKGRKSLTIVHKGNIMKFTEGMFKQWAYDFCEANYGDKVWTWQQYDRVKEAEGVSAADAAQKAALNGGAILVKDSIADAFLQQILLRPLEYDVIATLNLNGDYISDALAAMVGGIGIAPGANINYTTGVSLFEATHGTAPKYKGLDKVNPSSVILSGVMMLDYMGWSEAGDIIEKGIEGAIAKKRVTYDFERLMEGATTLKCSEFGTEIIVNMGDARIYPPAEDMDKNESSFVAPVAHDLHNTQELISESHEESRASHHTISESNEISSEAQNIVVESNEVTTESHEPISESNEWSSEDNDTVSDSNEMNVETHDTVSESNEITTDSHEPIAESNEWSSENIDAVSESNEPTSESNVWRSEVNEDRIASNNLFSETNEVHVESNDSISESSDTNFESTEETPVSYDANLVTSHITTSHDESEETQNPSVILDGLNADVIHESNDISPEADEVSSFSSDGNVLLNKLISDSNEETQVSHDEGDGVDNQ